MPSLQRSVAGMQKTKRAPANGVPSTAVEYTGKLTKSGNSSGFRFEAALFKSHPEFGGEVRARVIAPGRLLVTAEPAEVRHADPVIASFLAFLQQDMVDKPHRIRPLDETRLAGIKSLVRGVITRDDEDLGEESLLG